MLLFFYCFSVNPNTLLHPFLSHIPCENIHSCFVVQYFFFHNLTTFFQYIVQTYFSIHIKYSFIYLYIMSTELYISMTKYINTLAFSLTYSLYCWLFYCWTSSCFYNFHLHLNWTRHGFRRCEEQCPHYHIHTPHHPQAGTVGANAKVSG